MEDQVLESYTLCANSDYWKCFADIVKRKKFIGVKVTRSWLDNETQEQTEPKFVFSANLKELRLFHRNLAVVIKALEVQLDDGMQRR